MVEKANDSDCVVQVRGALSDHTEQGIMETCHAGAGDIVIDLSEMAFMNSAAAGMLVRLAVLAKKQGRRLRARGVSRHYHEVLQLTGLDGVIRLEADMAQGEKALDEGNWAAAVERLKVPQMPLQARHSSTSSSCLMLAKRRIMSWLGHLGQERCWSRLIVTFGFRAISSSCSPAASCFSSTFWSS